MLKIYSLDNLSRLCITDNELAIFICLYDSGYIVRMDRSEFIHHIILKFFDFSFDVRIRYKFLTIIADSKKKIMIPIGFISYREQDIKRMQALAVLDNPGGTPSQWVIDLRGSSRYIMAGVVIVSGVAALFVPEMHLEVKAIAFEGANIAFGFLFGQRIVTGFSKK